MALEESIVLPPPTARIKSICSFFAKFNTFVDETASWIWFYTAKFDVLDPFIFYRKPDAVKKSGADDTAAAVMNQDFCSAKSADIVACIVFFVFSKDKISRTVKSKIIHVSFLLLVLSLS